MALPVLLALISGGLLALIGVVFMIVYAWDFTRRYGVKKALLLLLYIVIALSIITLYISVWFIVPWIVGAITLTIGIIASAILAY